MWILIQCGFLKHYLISKSSHFHKNCVLIFLFFSHAKWANLVILIYNVKAEATTNQFAKSGFWYNVVLSGKLANLELTFKINLFLNQLLANL